MSSGLDLCGVVGAKGQPSGHLPQHNEDVHSPRAFSGHAQRRCVGDAQRCQCLAVTGVPEAFLAGHDAELVRGAAEIKVQSASSGSLDLTPEKEKTEKP